MITSALAARLATDGGLSPDSALHLDLIAVEKKIKTAALNGGIVLVFNGTYIGNPRFTDQMNPVIQVDQLTSAQSEFYEILINSGFAVTRDTQSGNRWKISWDQINPEGPVLRGPSGPSGPMTPFIAVSTTYQALKFQRLMVDTTSGPFSISLPVSPELNDEVHFCDKGSTFVTNNLTITRNGQKISSLESNFVCDTSGYFSFIFVGGSVGWRVLIYNSFPALKVANFSAYPGRVYDCDTTSGAFTATLPANPQEQDRIVFNDFAENWGTNNLTIAGNGKMISGGDNMICNISARIDLLYSHGSWIL